MRDYSKVSGQFWTGTTGKALRGDTLTQLLAMYLMTSPHANMIGVFHCPVLYMSHEIGSPIEGASESLSKLIKGAFCMYDDASETVFVKNMAKFQIGEQLDPKDKRVSGIQKLFDSLSDGELKTAFYEHYKTAFCLKPLASPLQAPTKPEAGTEAEAELLSSPQPRATSKRFPEFWLAWPATDRKTGKTKCEEKWKRFRCDDVADQILAHVEALKQTRKWQEGFEPAPMTYLNGKQWLDGDAVVQTAWAGAL